jgi:hypothetical protein
MIAAVASPRKLGVNALYTPLPTHGYDTVYEK